LPPQTYTKLEQLLEKLTNIHIDILEAEKKSTHIFETPERQYSAHNLNRYLAFRRHDVRQIQDDLASIGLSSLGRGEADILQSIENIIALIITIIGDAKQISDKFSAHQAPFSGKDVLSSRGETLFGKAPHYTRIMVTMPSEAAENYEMIESLMEKIWLVQGSIVHTINQNSGYK
jgi:pyruvate kinase